MTGSGYKETANSPDARTATQLYLTGGNGTVPVTLLGTSGLKFATYLYWDIPGG
jgi:hypothetical protein